MPPSTWVLVFSSPLPSPLPLLVTTIHADILCIGTGPTMDQMRTNQAMDQHGSIAGNVNSWCKQILEVTRESYPLPAIIKFNTKLLLNMMCPSIPVREKTHVKLLLYAIAHLGMPYYLW